MRAAEDDIDKIIQAIETSQLRLVSLLHIPVVDPKKKFKALTASLHSAIFSHDYDRCLSCLCDAENAGLIRDVLDFRSETNRERFTALEFAAFTGQEAIVSTILMLYNDVYAGRSLFLAYDRGYVGVCKILLEYYQQNFQSYDLGKLSPSTFFLDAVCYGNVQLVELLLVRGASRNEVLIATSRCRYGDCTPMQAALIKNHERMILALYKFGRPIFKVEQVLFVYQHQKAKLMFDIVDIEGNIEKILDAACHNNWLELIQVLLSKRHSFVLKKSHLDSAVEHADGILYSYLLDKLIYSNKDIPIGTKHTVASIQALTERGYFIPSLAEGMTHATSLSIMKAASEHDYLLNINFVDICEHGHVTIDMLTFFLVDGVDLKTVGELTKTTKTGHEVYWKHPLEAVDEDVVILSMQTGLLNTIEAENLFVFNCLQHRFQLAEKMMETGNVNAMKVEYSLLQQAVYHGGEKAVDLIEESVAKIAMTWYSTSKK